MEKLFFRFLAGVYFLIVAAALVTVLDAKASESCRHHDKCDKPVPVTQVTVVEKDKFTGEDFLKSAGILAISGCGITSIYQGAANGKWRWPYEWCLGMDRPKTQSIAADDKITPNNLSDQKINVRVVQ